MTSVSDPSLLNAVLRSTPDGLLALADDGAVLFFNDTLRSMWNLPGPLLQSRDGQALLTYITRHIRVGLSGETLWSWAMAGETQPKLQSTHPVRERLITLENRHVCRIRSAPLRKSGSVIGRLLSFQQVEEADNGDSSVSPLSSDRSPAEQAQALLASRGLTGNLLRTMNDGVLLEDSTGVILYLNPALEEMVGYSAEELVGLDFSQIVPPDQLDRVRKGAKRRVQGSSDRYESALLHRSGQRVPVTVSAMPLHDETEGYIGLLASFSDLRPKGPSSVQAFTGDQFLREILDNVDGVIILHNTDRPPRYFGNVKSITGYSPGLLRDHKVRWDFLLTEEDRELRLSLLNQAARQSDFDRTIEYRITCQDGGSRWIRERIVASDSAETVQCLIRDITERRDLETALRYELHVENQLLAFSSRLHSPPRRETDPLPALEICRNMTEADGVHLLANEIAQDGTLTFHLIGAAFRQDRPLNVRHLPEDNLGYHPDFVRWEQALSTGKPLRGFISSMPESERRLFAGRDVQSVLLMPVGTETAWFGTLLFEDSRHRSWSEKDMRLQRAAADLLVPWFRQKQAIERADASQQRFRTVVDHARHGIFILTGDSVVFANPALCRMLDVEHDCLEDAHPMRWVDEADHGELKQLLQARSSADTLRLRFRAHLPGAEIDGEEVQLDAVAVRWEDQPSWMGIVHPPGHEAAVRPATTSADTDPALISTESEDSQAQEMAERTARFASIGALVATVNHELNQPLNALRMGTEGIQLWLKANPALLPEFIQKNLIDMGAAIDRIAGTVDNFRRYSVDAHEPKPGHTDLNDIVRDALTFSRRRLQNHAVELQTDIADEALPIYVRRLHVEQMIHHCLLSAVSALDHAKHRNKLIILRTYTDGDQGVLSIEDNGPGFNTEDMDRVFDLPSPSSRGEAVSALSLPIVKVLARREAARIRATSSGLGGVALTLSFNLRPKED